jgi:uroporphyrinogen decarboxylase
MKEMTGAERILTTLQHREPDRVPHFELYIHQKVRDALVKPGATYFDAVDHLNLDALVVDDLPQNDMLEMIDSNRFRNKWGVIWQITPDSIHPVEGPIKSEKDLDNWVLPDPDKPALYDQMREMVKKYKGQKAVISAFQDPFDIATSMRGTENYFKDFILNPKLVDRIGELLKSYYMRYIKNCMEVGVDIIFITGDYATTKWPMLSNKFFARHVIPILKALTEESQRLGAYVFKHTDGNVMPLMDLLMDSGINGLHPIDPNAGMNLAFMKEKYGEKLTLLGNVDCAQTLSWGTADDVRAEVKRCLRQGSKGGGYVCMSSNTIHSAVKPENYMEMIKAIREYGKYPVSV